MISVSVRYLVNFSIVTGKKQENVMITEGATLKDLLNLLVERYGQSLEKELFNLQTGEVKTHVLILINGRSVDQYKDKLHTALSYGDSIIFTFPVTGG